MQIGLKLATLSAVVAIAIAIAAPASAEAGSCTHRTGVRHVDTYGHVYTQDWVCGNRRGAGVWHWASIDYLNGYLDTSPSWFVCYVHGQMHYGNNDVWYRTQGDRAIGTFGPAEHAWGYVPAAEVWTSIDPWPGMVHC